MIPILGKKTREISYSLLETCISCPRRDFEKFTNIIIYNIVYGFLI
mgnify:CR=1 FL=1